MKRLRTILVFLLLGAVVNVAVAWGFAWLLPNYGLRGDDLVFGLSTSQPPGWQVTRVELFYSTSIAGSALMEATDNWWDSILLEDSERPELPRWSGMNRPPTSTGDISEGAYGWPFRSVMWGIYYNSKRGAWVINDDVILPVTPIWTGVIFNTLFYALFFWFLILGPFVLRRHFRRTRSLCLKCAYDLKGAAHEACPECGEGVPLRCARR